MRIKEIMKKTFHENLLHEILKNKSKQLNQKKSVQHLTQV